MAYFSQNGWTANDRSQIATYTVPGTNGKLSLRKGDVSVILLDFAGWWNATIEPLVWPGCWGYAEKTITGGSGRTLSNHASGCAEDLNAPLHPQGVPASRNLSNQQIALIRARIALYRGMRWGGDYKSAKVDAMHAEWIGSADLARTVADQIRNRTFAGGNVFLVGDNPVTPAKGDVTVAPSTPAPPSDLLRRGDSGQRVTDWQGELWRVGIGVGIHDGIYGDATEGGTRILQSAAGIGVDGIVGPSTRTAATSVPNYPKPDGPALPLAEPNGARPTIQAFQQRLRDRGWNVTVDGFYGPQTRDVLRKFQNEKGLIADGIGGGATWVALWTRTL